MQDVDSFPKLTRQWTTMVFPPPPSFDTLNQVATHLYEAPKDKSPLIVLMLTEVAARLLANPTDATIFMHRGLKADAYFAWSASSYTQEQIRDRSFMKIHSMILLHQIRSIGHNDDSTPEDDLVELWSVVKAHIQTPLSEDIVYELFEVLYEILPRIIRPLSALRGSPSQEYRHVLARCLDPLICIFSSTHQQDGLSLNQEPLRWLLSLLRGLDNMLIGRLPQRRDSGRNSTSIPLSISVEIVFLTSSFDLSFVHIVAPSATYRFSLHNQTRHPSRKGSNIHSR